MSATTRPARRGINCSTLVDVGLLASLAEENRLHQRRMQEWYSRLRQERFLRSVGRRNEQELLDIIMPFRILTPYDVGLSQHTPDRLLAAHAATRREQVVSDAVNLHKLSANRTLQIEFAESVEHAGHVAEDAGDLPE